MIAGSSNERQPSERGSSNASVVVAGAIDTHVHIFDPRRFHYAVPRTYTPGPALTADLTKHLAHIGFSRAVLVQPSVYGTDNRCLVDALQILGPALARGVAVIDPVQTTNAELQALADAGVTGLRVNIHTSGGTDPSAAIAEVAKTARRAADFGLLVQLYVDLALVEHLEATIAGSPVPVVLDHFAGLRAGLGTEQVGFAALRRLLDAGKVWIKLSALYRAGMRAPGYEDVATIAKLMIASNPERLVWGSDWPHTSGGADRASRRWDAIEPFRNIDNARAVALMRDCAGSSTMCDRIFVSNATGLFRF